MHQMEDAQTRKQVLIDAAIDNNEPELLGHVLKINAQERMGDYENRRLVEAATRKNSIPCLRYLIEHGLSIEYIDISGGEVSISALEFLLAHGWDINSTGTPRSYRSPFMWSCIHDREKLVWCLEHGASLATPWQEPHRKPREPILERVAWGGDIATFELLRSKGAPLGPCTLHQAVVRAAFCHDFSGDPEKDDEKQRQGRAQYTQSMAMVRYLIDVVGLNVNKEDFPPDTKWLQGEWGTPLQYIVLAGLDPGRNARELVWFLLDRGADPKAALVEAKAFGGHAAFKEWVEAWEQTREEKKDKSRCTVL
ncbi:unnamed protein product [Alternaria alternata]